MHPDPDHARALRTRLLTTAALLAALVLAPRAAHAVQAAPTDGARAVIQDTADKVIALLHDPKLDSRARRERILGIVDSRIDIIVVSKLVLAKHYNRFTPDQQEEFRKQFREHLISTYYRNAEAARFSTIEIYESREEDRGDWTVRSKVVSKEQGNTLIDYRMRKAKTGEWQIIDITIESVSLVQNFRAQFQEVLSSKEPVKLLEMLREKNATAAATDAATDKNMDARGNGPPDGTPSPADGSDGAGGNSVKGGGTGIPRADGGGQQPAPR